MDNIDTYEKYVLNELSKSQIQVMNLTWENQGLRKQLQQAKEEFEAYKQQFDSCKTAVQTCNCSIMPTFTPGEKMFMVEGNFKFVFAMNKDVVDFGDGGREKILMLLKYYNVDSKLPSLFGEVNDRRE